MLKDYACIFDLDGVLIHTSHFHFIAWQRLAKRLGYDLTAEENEQLKGVSRLNSLMEIAKWANVELSEAEQLKWMRLKNEWYLELVEELKPADTLPGVPEFLVELRQAGVGLAVGSASKNARLILEKIQLTDHFDAIVDGTNTTKSKPDPQVFLYGAAVLDRPPDKTVVFEDSPAGILAAKTGGFRSIGVGDKDVLKEADLVIPSFENFSILTFSDFLNI